MPIRPRHTIIRRRIIDVPSDVTSHILQQRNAVSLLGKRRPETPPDVGNAKCRRSSRHGNRGHGDETPTVAMDTDERFFSSLRPR